jgi:hypothetical protein
VNEVEQPVVDNELQTALPSAQLTKKLNKYFNEVYGVPSAQVTEENEILEQQICQREQIAAGVRQPMSYLLHTRSKWIWRV